MLKDEFLTEIFLMTGFMLIVIAGASYDMWKSADMIYARFSLTPFCRVSAYTFVCVCVCVCVCVLACNVYNVYMRIDKHTY